VPCGDGCSYRCTGSSGSQPCTLRFSMAQMRWGVQCGMAPPPTPAGPPSTTPFCPNNLTPSTTAPCGEGCMYNCGASQCRLTFDAAQQRWAVNCPASTVVGSATPAPAGARTIQPFCPNANDQPSSFTACGDGCQYVCSGQTCTLSLSASAGWSVRCGSGGGVGSTNPAATGVVPQTTAPPAGEIPCPDNAACANMLPNCALRYCGCTSGQLTRYFCNAGLATTAPGLFTQPDTTATFFFPLTNPPTFTMQQATTRCDIASLCDSYPSVPSCTVATGASCICNAQQQVISKSCGATVKDCVQTTAAVRACDLAQASNGGSCKTSTGAVCKCDGANNVVSKLCTTLGGTVTVAGPGKCNQESLAVCADVCKDNGDGSKCNCNADGSLKACDSAAAQIAFATAALVGVAGVFLL
jgi:hypothetical protein